MSTKNFKTLYDKVVAKTFRYSPNMHVHFKYKTIRFVVAGSSGYIASEGRVLSLRNKSKLSSVLIRNKKFGVQQRVFLYNPAMYFTT